jgi:hypothetical protein
LGGILVFGRLIFLAFLEISPANFFHQYIILLQIVPDLRPDSGSPSHFRIIDSYPAQGMVPVQVNITVP